MCPQARVFDTVPGPSEDRVSLALAKRIEALSLGPLKRAAKLFDYSKAHLPLEKATLLNDISSTNRANETSSL